MEICEEGHDPIVFEAKNRQGCPLCLVKRLLDEELKRSKELDRMVEQYEEEKASA